MADKAIEDKKSRLNEIFRTLSDGEYQDMLTVLKEIEKKPLAELFIELVEAAKFRHAQLLLQEMDQNYIRARDNKTPLIACAEAGWVDGISQLVKSLSNNLEQQSLSKNGQRKAKTDHTNEQDKIVTSLQTSTNTLSNMQSSPLHTTNLSKKDPVDNKLHANYADDLNKSIKTLNKQIYRGKHNIDNHVYAPKVRQKQLRRIP